MAEIVNVVWRPVQSERSKLFERNYVKHFLGGKYPWQVVNLNMTYHK